MTLDFDLKDVMPYVDCGSAVNNTTHTTTSALQALGLTALTLEGTANINIRPKDHGKRPFSSTVNTTFPATG